MPTMLIPRCRSRAFRCVLAILVVSVMTPIASAQSFHQLPIPSSWVNIQAYDVANGGTAAACAADNAARWTSTPGVNGTSTVIGSLSIVGGSVGRGITPDGSVVVGSSPAPGGVGRAFRWTQAGGMVGLGVIPGGDYSDAFDVNADGTVVVGQGDTTGVNTNRRAARWTQATGMVNLGVLPGGNISRAHAVSGDGSIVVGYSEITGGFNRAFRWTQSTGMVDLGVLPGTTSSLAWGISQDGSTIVGVSGGGGINKAFRWTQAGGMQDLGFLVTQNSVAWSASADGAVIVGFSGNRPFIWTAAGGMADLVVRLQAFGTNLTGISLNDAPAISPDATSVVFLGSLPALSNTGFIYRNMPCIYPPTVSQHPTGGTLCAGGTIVLSGAGAGGGGLAYSWLLNGNPVAEGSTGNGTFYLDVDTGDLTIGNIQPAHAGQYTLVVTSPCGQVLSNTATVNVLPTNPIVGQPVGTTVCPGDNDAYFTVVANPISGTTYQWYKRVPPNPNVYAPIFDGPTGNGGLYGGTQGPTMVIAGCYAGDFDRYRCVVSGPCGLPETSANALLSSAALIVTSQPTDTAQCIGDNDAYFTVGVSPAPGATYQWAKQQLPFPNVYNPIFDGPTGNGGNFGGTQGPTLVIAGCYPGDFARYRCTITGPCGDVVVSNNAQLLNVPTATITTQPVNTSQCLGDNDAEFSVVVTPSAGVTYQWYKRVPPSPNVYAPIFDGPKVGGGNYGGTQTALLTIGGCYAADFDRYRCTITGPCGEVEVSANALLSQITNPVIATQPTGGQACRGGTYALSVTVAPGNTGPLTYQWRRIFGSTPTDGVQPTGTIFAGTQTPTFTISNFRVPDAGQFFCEVTGSCGFVNSEAVIVTVCAADYNCSGVVSVQDIFDFLAGYFSNDLAADFNASGTISVQDIFDFLAAYFAGC